jgi:hypothetical protein
MTDTVDISTQIYGTTRHPASFGNKVVVDVLVSCFFHAFS